jgi:hypothetical protein
VTGQFVQNKKAKMTVFMQQMGQTMEASFLVGVGESIGGKQTVTVYNPTTNERIRKTFDFTTGGMVLSEEFKDVVRDGIRRPTVEVLYVDGDGNLHRVIQVTDMPRESSAAKRYNILRLEVPRF